MPTRLVWNFEVCEKNPIDFNRLSSDETDSIRWEARYFWQQNEIIILNGLNAHFLDLNNYKIKSRQDSYYLLADSFYNIKARREEILYKPLLKNNTLSQGFGKKINLLDSSRSSLLNESLLTQQALLEQIKKNSKKIDVYKVALLYKFNTSPTIKLELARLTIANDCYFSACIEGYSEKIVNQISQRILTNLASCDYVHFLKKHYD